MGESNIVNICVFGEKYSLACSSDEEYVKKLADYVNSKINDINKARNGNYMSPSLRNVLLSLNIADDYFREAEKNKLFPENDKSETELLRQQNENLKKRLSYAERQGNELRNINRKLIEQLRALGDSAEQTRMVAEHSSSPDNKGE